MSQSDVADAPCLKFYFLYNPNMLWVPFTFFKLHLTMSILYLYLFICLVVAVWHGNYSLRKVFLTKHRWRP